MLLRSNQNEGRVKTPLPNTPPLRTTLRASHDTLLMSTHTQGGYPMRPNLHPAMGQTVICARVAVQLAARLYEFDRPHPLKPERYAVQAARNLPLDYPGFLRFALHSLAVYLELGWGGRQWLDSVLEAAHYGHSFRRCYFFEYKANRSPYPRVTNRGVQTSPSPTGFPTETGKHDA